jgi:polysaccharide export outer membrane protein
MIMAGIRPAFLFLLCLLPVACSSIPPSIPLPVEGLKASIDLKDPDIAPIEVLKAFEDGLNRDYLLGPGDVVDIMAPALPEIAGDQTISPDGNMTVYLAGEMKVIGKTRSEAETMIKESLRRYFDIPALTLRIKTFENNQVFVLGRVTSPGPIKFRGRPNLLEAISRAGAFSGSGQVRPPYQCAIIRGKDQMLWVSLEEMLHGGSHGRNLDLAGDDIIYIPDVDEGNVFILGEVGKPGAYDIAGVKTILDVVAKAGGPTENAVIDNVLLIRSRGREPSQPIRINLDVMIKKADFSGNIMLTKNDIIYVPRNGLSNYNYYLRMINPFTQFFVTGYALGK